MNIEILNTVEVSEVAQVLELDNSSTSNSQLCGFEVHFTVKATNADSETQEFDIVCETEERSLSRKSYNGYEMDLSKTQGDTEELEEFLDYDDLINELKDKAQEMAKRYFMQQLIVG
jgi:hypothetical protein